MGTNYYQHRPLTRKRKDEIIKAVEEDRILSVSYNNPTERGFENDRVDITQREIYVHIGKLSAGWQFIFDHNDWEYYGKNRKQIEEFVNDPQFKILDECGEELSKEDFWYMVERSKDGKSFQGDRYDSPDLNIEGLRVADRAGFT